eukprot:467691-Pleurochrysis_carterae.AAC.1
MPAEIRARIGGFVLDDDRSYGRYMSTSKDARMVMDENFTSLTPRGRALLISKRARKNHHNESYESAEPRGEVRKFLFALLGPPLIPRDIGMQPDDLQLETMEEIRKLVEYPTSASDDWQDDDGDGTRNNPIPMDLRRRYDYLNVEELQLRLNGMRDPRVLRHLITFDFLARHHYMTLEEVVLRFSAFCAADKTFMDDWPQILQDE